MSVKLSDEKYWLGCKLIPEIDKKIWFLLDIFKEPQIIWKAGQKDLAKTNLFDDNSIEKIIRRRKEIDLSFELKKLKEEKIGILTLSDPQYPKLLKEIPYPPPLLFYQGDLIKKYEYGVAIVGSRRATLHGKVIAEEIATELSSVGVTIVSGLARGIDTSAHQGALKEKGKTIGVLGCGIDIIYPRENKKLYREIAEKGSLVTEFLAGIPPFQQNFPRRNRIISGLSLGVLVIEAGEKSGALITASFALDQNREVMAIPGSIKNKLSAGPNNLIKQGACLVKDASDVLENLGLKSLVSFLKEKKLRDKEPIQLQPFEQKILDFLGEETKNIDEILRSFSEDPSFVLSQLTMLELKGYIRQAPGKNYIRTNYNEQ